MRPDTSRGRPESPKSRRASSNGPNHLTNSALDLRTIILSLTANGVALQQPGAARSVCKRLILLEAIPVPAHCTDRLLITNSHPSTRRTSGRFYRKKHKFTCGVDLHTRTIYLCILDADGGKVLQKNMPPIPTAFLSAIKPCSEDLVVGKIGNVQLKWASSETLAVLSHKIGRTVWCMMQRGKPFDPERFYSTA